MLIMDDRLDFNVLVNKHASNPALVWPQGKLTYLQYFRQIDHMSKELSKRGIKSGDTVAIVSDVNVHFPIIFFAIVKMGCIVLPVNPKFPESRINEILIKFKNC